MSESSSLRHQRQEKQVIAGETKKVSLIGGACTAARRNDLAALSQVLKFKLRHCNASIGASPLNLPLLNSTKQAQLLHQHLFSQHDCCISAIKKNETINASKDNSFLLIRSLLMVPPTYETPWLAAYEIVCRIQQQQQQGQSSRGRQRKSSIKYVAEIQCFIRQTVSTWWEKERQWNTHTTNSGSTAPSSSLSSPSSQKIQDIRNATTTTTTKTTTTTCCNTPQDWILKLSRKLIEPLRMVDDDEHETKNNKNNDDDDDDDIRDEQQKEERCFFWMILLDLVTTIVSVMQGLDHTFHQQILDIVFLSVPSSTTIPPHRYLSWLNLATDLHSFLRIRDWDNLLLNLQRSISAKRRRRYQQRYQKQQQAVVGEGGVCDLADLMRAAVSISHKLLLYCDEGNKNEQEKARESFRAWGRAALDIFCCAAYHNEDPRTLSKVTTAFRDSISGLPSDSLPEWLSTVMGTITRNDNDNNNNKNIMPSSSDDDEVENSVPNWVKTNVVLTLMSVERKSGNFMLNKLLSRALENSGMGQSNVTGECWKALVHLASYGDKNVDQGEKSAKDTTNSSREIQLVDATNLVQGSFYVGRGLFGSEKKKGGNIEFLNLGGALVYQSLFLRSDNHRNSEAVVPNPADVEDRALEWIRAATDGMRSLEGISSSTPEAVVIAVAFVVVFCEVPSSRKLAGKAMLQALTGNIDVALLTASVIATIVKPTPGATSSYAEMKPILDLVVAGSLPTKIVFPLVQAFATATTAQDPILAFVRKCLCQQGDLSFGISPAINDGMQCSLYALCSLIAVPVWTDPVMNAWKILVEILVHSRYSLHLETRSWLWNLVEDFVASGRFSQSVAERLFRICLLRLICISRKDELDGRMSLCPSSVLAVWMSGKTAPTEDLTSLFKLLFSLFFSCTHKVGTRNRQVIEQWRSLVLSCCGSVANARPQPPLVFFDETDGGDDDDNQPNIFSLCKLSVGLTLSALDFALACSARDNSQEPLRQIIADTIRGLDLQTAKQKLISQELSSYDASVLDVSHVSSPEWLREHTKQDRIRESIPQKAIKSMASAILHSIAGFIRDSRWCICGTDLQSYEERKLSLLGLDSLSKLARSLDHHSEEVACIYPGSSSSFIQKELASFGALINNSAIVINHCVSANKDFADTNNILSIAMEQLDDLALLLDDNLTTDQISQTDLVPLFYAIWQLYSLVFDENASLLLISYIEANVSTGCTTENVSNACDSSSEVSKREARIRRMRRKVLDLLKRCLQQFVREGAMNEIMVSHESAGSWSRGEATTEDAVTFWVNCLRKLGGDLCCGLEGHSGGVSFVMYENYFECISMVSKLLSNHCRNLSTSMIADIRPIVESESMLWSGFCRYPPLDRKSMFAKAFAAIGQSLPSLGRCISRMEFLQGMAEANSDAPDVTVESPLGNFGIRSFELCAETLKEWINVDQESSRPSWVTLTVPHTTDDNTMLSGEGMEEDSSNSPQNKGQEQVPAVVTVSVQCTPRSSRTNQQADTHAESARLDLITKEMWCWTCSGALAAIEKIWIDAYESIRSVDTDGSQEVEFPLSRLAEDYAGQRIEHLSKVNKTLRLAFVATTTYDPPMDTGQWLVQAFPPDMKSRLCSLIEKIVNTTFASVKVLDSFLQGKRRPKTLCFVEALAVFWVWITADKYEGFDIATHTRKWHEAEKKRISSTQDALQRYLADNAVPTQFPRLMFRIEKLESSLWRLHHFFLTQDKQSPSVSRIKFIECFLTAVNSGTVSSEESLKATIERKVQNMSEALVSTSERAAVKRNNETSLDDKPKRRKKKGRSQHLRSRNQTVDKWLRSDQQYGPDQDKDDAFLDLEDFIADG